MLQSFLHVLLFATKALTANSNVHMLQGAITNIDTFYNKVNIRREIFSCTNSVFKDNTEKTQTNCTQIIGLKNMHFSKPPVSLHLLSFISLAHVLYHFHTKCRHNEKLSTPICCIHTTLLSQVNSWSSRFTQEATRATQKRRTAIKKRMCKKKDLEKVKRVLGGGGRSRDWAVWLNHAVRADLFSFSFHPPLFMSAPSTHACTQEKGHHRTQNAAFKGNPWEFFVFCVKEHSTVCDRVCLCCLVEEVLSVS